MTVETFSAPAPKRTSRYRERLARIDTPEAGDRIARAGPLRDYPAVLGQPRVTAAVAGCVTRLRRCFEGPVASLLRSIFVIAVALFTGPTASAESTAFTVSRYSNGNANVYLVETARHVVLIDSGFWVGDGPELGRRIAATGKPLAAILLTHGHWDHYYGAANIPGAQDVPFIASRGANRQILDHHGAYEGRIRPLFGARLVMQRRFPDLVVDSGYVFTIDGVAFAFQDLGPGESLSDGVWMVEVAGQTHAFVGDLVFPEIHAFFQDGHAYDWRRSLQGLQERLPAGTFLYPGHGAPGGLELVTAQIGYIDAVLAAISSGNVSDREGRAGVVAELARAYPNLRNVFLLEWSLDIAAAEIALEDARQALPARIEAASQDR